MHHNQIANSVKNLSRRLKPALKSRYDSVFSRQSDRQARSLGSLAGPALVIVALVTVGGVTSSMTRAESVLLQYPVVAGSDDAEEKSTGAVSLDSSDLELVTDSYVQTVGIRFAGIAVPQNAKITNAYIQFTTDEAKSEATSLTIRGQALDNAPTFTTASQNISSRPKTAASASWSPVAWPTAGVAGPDQRTPSLTAVVQEIVDRSGWNNGNALAFSINGSGKRTAAAFEGSRTEPKLYIEYEAAPTTPPPPAENTAPVVSAGPDQTLAGGTSGTPTGTTGTPTPGLPGTLSGVMPEANSHLGPYKDGNGNLYTVMEDVLAKGNKPKAMKSSNHGATWTEIDVANRPQKSDLEGYWLEKVGTTIYFGWQKSSGPVYLSAFNTSDAPTNPDKWIIKDVQLSSTEPAEQWVNMNSLSNGDLWVFYGIGPNSAGEQMGFRKRVNSTGALSGQVSLDTTKSVTQVVSVTGAGDITHIFYNNFSTKQIFYRTLSPTGTLSAAKRVDTGTTNKQYVPMTNAVLHTQGGQEYATVAFGNSSYILKSISVNTATGTPSAEATVSAVPVTANPGTGSKSIIAHLGTDGSTVYALYSDESTDDIWYDQNSGAGWGGSDAKIVNNVQTLWITGANVYTNSSGLRVLGYIYSIAPFVDDGGNHRYGEYAIGGTAPTGPTEPVRTTTLQGSVTDDGLPNPPGSPASQWTLVEGPGTAAFSDPASPTSQVTFSGPGVYTLRLTATDTAMMATDEVVITVQ